MFALFSIRRPPLFCIFSLCHDHAYCCLRHHHRLFVYKAKPNQTVYPSVRQSNFSFIAGERANIRSTRRAVKLPQALRGGHGSIYFHKHIIYANACMCACVRIFECRKHLCFENYKICEIKMQLWL